ncbi:MAG: hypothetical protein Q8M29_17355 [Bacteroidota bacterium]|nr:hypothetical protein [Bacteroidota bacterium]
MSLNQVFTLLSRISASSVLIPIITSLFFFKAFNSQLKALFIYLVVCLVTEISGEACIYLEQDNYAIYNTFTLIETILVFYIYYKEFNLTKYNYLFLIVPLAILIYGGMRFSLVRSNNLTSSIEAISLSICALLYFYKVFVDMTIPKLTSYYFFWINSAFLLYFLSPFFISLFENIIRNSHSPVLNYLWVIYLFITVLFNIVVTVGICKIKRN